jgi:hypothetical protein
VLKGGQRSDDVVTEVEVEVVVLIASETAVWGYSELIECLGLGSSSVQQLPGDRQEAARQGDSHI